MARQGPREPGRPTSDPAPLPATPPPASARGAADGAETFDLDGGAPDLVRIDGVTFALMRSTALSLRTRARAIRIWQRLEAIEGIADPTADDEAEYEQQLRALAPIALPDASAATLARLTVEQLGDVALTFFARGLERSPRTTSLMRLARRTTANSSPGSSAPTAGTRGDG